MRGLISFFIEKRIATFIFVAIVALTGTKAYLTLPREAAPDLKIPVVLVTVPYPGVSPTDIETLIVRELESELKDLKDVKVMRSTSAEGAGIVSIEFNPDIDIDDAVRKVREKVDTAEPKFPSDAMDPVVKEVSFEDFPIITVDLSANYSLVKLKSVAEDLQDELEEIKGVLEVNLSGGIEREVQVLLDKDKLAHQAVGVGEVVRAIQGANVNMPGGQVEAGRSSFLVRIPGEIEKPHEIEDIVIKTRDLGPGQAHIPLLVKDVGRVIDTYKERATYSRMNGVESVSITVSKRAGENLINIVDQVKEIVDGRKDTLPPGTKVTFLQDQSKFIKSMVNDLQNNILTGLLLVLAVLPFFLTVRSSMIVASAIPLALLMSMTIIESMGITLNMIVLFSLILSLGMLVDNSIVVVENIYRYLSQGSSRFEAAVQGTAEVAWPVIASTATTVAAFAPLLFWPGVMGGFMGYLPRTVIITLMSSLFVALAVNPLMCVVLLEVNEKHQVDEDTEPTTFMYSFYRKTVELALKNGWTAMLTVFASGALLVASVMVYAGSGLGVEFFPEGTPDSAWIELRAADGTRVDATDTIVRRVEARLTGRENIRPHVKNFVSSIGQSATGGGAAAHLGTVTVDFLDEDDRKESSAITTDTIRKAVQDIPGASFEVKKPAMGPPAGPPIGVELIGEDWEVLAELTQKVTLSIRDVPNLVDLKDDFNLGRPEVQIRVDREKAKLVGTSVGQVGQAVRTAVNGTEATTLREGEDETKVMVRFEEDDRKSLQDLENLIVAGREGAQVPLSEVAEVVTTAGAGSIRHKDRERVVTISANADGRLPDEVRKDVVKIVKDLDFPKGYSWRLAGQQEEQQAAGEFLGGAFMLAFLMILLILVLQFNSLSTPAVILSSVPLAMVGVLIGLVIFQRPFGVVMSGLGVISLAGVAVNNAIVFIDFVLSRFEKVSGFDRVTQYLDKETLTEAIVFSGVMRLRPVLLTAITTVLGLLPMAMGVGIDFMNMKITVGGRSGEMWSGMAIAVACGLVFTTILTLIVVPTAYYLICRVLIVLLDKLPSVLQRILNVPDAPAEGFSVAAPAAQSSAGFRTGGDDGAEACDGAADSGGADDAGFDDTTVEADVKAMAANAAGEDDDD